MSKSHTDKHERADLGSVGRRVVSAGALKARNFLAVFLVFQIIFGLTFGLLFFADIKVGALPVSASVAGTDLSKEDNSFRSNYSVADIAVSSDGTVEIGSLAGLLIAAYAYNSDKSVADILGGKIQGANANARSFRLVNNISGIFTAQDISALDDAFAGGWGKSSEGTGALENVVRARTGDTLTILNSLFGDFSGIFDGNGYVINAFNLMGGTDDAHMDNAGFFAKIEKDATVTDIHLRNVNVVADGVTNVGGLAGTALSNVTNVSVHGMFNVRHDDASESNLGGIFGTFGGNGTAPTLKQAIVLGTIYSEGVSYVGGAVGKIPGGNIQKAVSMMCVFSTCEGRSMVGGVVGLGGDFTLCCFLENSVWQNGKTVANSSGISLVLYSTLYSGSVSGYESDSLYYVSNSKKHVLVDALDNHTIDNMKSDDAPRESMRLCDLIDVYLLNYSLQEDRVQVDGAYYNIYVKSENSWLVGNAKGTDTVEGGSSEADPIIIVDQQGVPLLRELRFATFKLTADVYLPASYEFETWQGAFFGKIYNNKTGDNAYDEDGYHIYIKGYKDENIFELTPTGVGAVKFPVKGY